MAARSPFVGFAERAFAPVLPERTLPDGAFSFSSISPVAIFAMVTMQPMASAGRFCPCSPFGIKLPFGYLRQAYRSQVAKASRESRPEIFKLRHYQPGRFLARNFSS